MADWSLPTLTSTYANFRQNLTDRDVDAATQFSVGTPTNMPTGAIRWNSGIGRWQVWSGTAWGELTSTYAFTGVTCTSFSNTGNTTLGDASADTVTVNAATFTFANPTTIAGTIDFSGSVTFDTDITLTGGNVFLSATTLLRRDWDGVNAVRVYNGNTTSNAVAQFGLVTGLASTAVYMAVDNNAGSPYFRFFGGSTTAVSIGYWDLPKHIWRDPTASNAEMMRATTAGLNIGGGADPAYRLVVNGSTRIQNTGVLRLQSGNGTTTVAGDTQIYADTNDLVVLTGATAAERFRITATGAITSSALADAVGYKGIPQNAQTAAYTLALTDMGKHISITTGGITVPANASVAFPIGSTVVIFNNSASSQNIAITTDTLRLAGTTSTGTRTVAAYGLATLVKVAATVWVVSGAGVS
ncbi:MAG: hypothetical protein CGW95_01500 [Phenylobacterium zucineum]|nr:MAG: hypothetical protein CGW95_01500 [Phenylobacterium zucineum]